VRRPIPMDPYMSSHGIQSFLDRLSFINMRIAAMTEMSMNKKDFIIGGYNTIITS
jgi:hypothetical protein